MTNYNELRKILDNDLRGRLIDIQSAMTLLQEDLDRLRDPVAVSNRLGQVIMGTFPLVALGLARSVRGGAGNRDREFRLVGDQPIPR